MLERQDRRGVHGRTIESVEQRGDTILVSIAWLDERGGRHRWAHVLKLDGGKIVDIQAYASPGRAALATRLRALTAG